MTRFARRYRDWLEADAEQWGVSAKLAWFLFVAPLAGVPLLMAAFLNRDLFDVLLVEDGVAETLQVVFLLGVVVFAALLVRPFARQGRRVAALAYAVLAVGALFVAFEEVSWGQRLLGLETPAVLQDVNTQGELNVHNIKFIEDTFEFGQLIGSLYGILVPLAVVAMVAPTVGGRLDRALVPPLFLAGALLISFTYRLLKYILFPSGTYVTNRFAEYSEFVLYGAILIVAFLGYRRWAADRRDMDVAVQPSHGGT